MYYEQMNQTTTEITKPQNEPKWKGYLQEVSSYYNLLFKGILGAFF
jgi:hypothetical protein